MDFSAEQLTGFERVCKTYITPPYDSVNHSLDSLGEAWKSHPLCKATTVELLSESVLNALDLVCAQADLFKKQETADQSATEVDPTGLAAADQLASFMSICPPTGEDPAAFFRNVLIDRYSKSGETAAAEAGTDQPAHLAAWL